MIRVAAGEKLGIRQRDVTLKGHALEARIYAEDPDANFAPSPGEILTYRVPGGPGVRVDSGVYQGARVTVHYDPMVAKLVTWGPNRHEAIDRMKRALSEFVVQGIKTSIPFHQRVMRHPKFLEGDYDTGFIETHLKGNEPGDDGAGEARRVAMMLAAIAAYRRDKERAERLDFRPVSAAAESAWKSFGRRAQMRSGLR